MKILNANQQNILNASEIIKNGGLVAFPTETVYGLGANGLNPVAVAKIFEAKQRPSFNPLILHISNYKQLDKIINQDIKSIKPLMDKFWPGPLTIILQKSDLVPDIVTAGHTTVAVRMPSHKVALELIELAGTPIAAPSANSFSQLSPTKALHVFNQLGDKVDLILDGGDSNVGVESTIIEIQNDNIYLLRPGGLAIEEIESFMNTKLIKRTENNINPNSPGQLFFHYSPNTPLKIIGEFDFADLTNKKIGAILFRENSYNINFKSTKILSPTGSLPEAAANLFKYLHELENEELDIIIAEPVEPVGLGLAIMDRLRKAANRYV